MDKLVGAENITEISVAGAFVDDFPPPPDALQTLRMLEQKARKNPQDTYEAGFLRALTRMPTDMVPVPVLYSRIGYLENKEIWHEYNTVVLPQYLRFLAENHAADLRTLGICEFGIHRMKCGLYPANEEGALYEISVDHVIERAGSGVYGRRKSKDPFLPADAPETFEINHIANLCLMPTSVHSRVKNAINDMQAAYMQVCESDSGWTVMAVWQRPQPGKGHIYIPGGADRKKFPITPRKNIRFERYLRDAGFMMDQACQALLDFKKQPSAQSAFRKVLRGAKFAGIRPEKALAQDISLTRIFMDTLDEQARKVLAGRIKPVVHEAVRKLEETYKLALEELRAGNRTKAQQFKQVYQGTSDFDFKYGARDLRLLIEALPLSEQTSAARIFDDMEQKIANDNVMGIRLVTFRPPPRSPDPQSRHSRRKKKREHAQNPHYSVSGRRAGPRRQGS